MFISFIFFKTSEWIFTKLRLMKFTRNRKYFFRWAMWPRDFLFGFVGVCFAKNTLNCLPSFSLTCQQVSENCNQTDVQKPSLKNDMLGCSLSLSLSLSLHLMYYLTDIFFYFKQLFKDTMLSKTFFTMPFRFQVTGTSK